MLIFRHVLIVAILLMLSSAVHPFLIGLIILVLSFFWPIYVPAILSGYYIDEIFLTGRENIIIYQYTISFAILVAIGQYIRKRLVR